MFKGKDLIGKHIISYDAGEKFDVVADLIFDQESNQLLGFLVQETGWFKRARVLQLSEVQAIGVDAVIASSKGAIAHAHDLPDIGPILDHDTILKGTHILTLDGRDLGVIVDLYFDETNGKVEGYEVSGGLFADAYSGRSFVPAADTLKIGRDVAFVPVKTAQLMEEQVGGLRGAMQSASDQWQETAQLTGDKLHELSQSAGEQWQETTQRTGERLHDLGERANERFQATSQQFGQATQETVQGVGPSFQGFMANATVEQAMGRRAQHPVRNEAGSILLASGQIVTPSVIEQVKVHHRERLLLQAVGLSTGAALQGSAGQAMTGAGDRLHDSSDQFQAGAKKLWQQIRQAASDLQHRTARANETKQMQAALGRPVTRVILDQQDQVILNVGELITHQAIASARQAEVLDLLLNSVYIKSPELSLEALRAPQAGHASLERT